MQEYSDIAQEPISAHDSRQLPLPPPSLSASSNDRGGSSICGDITFSRLTGRYPNRYHYSKYRRKCHTNSFKRVKTSHKILIIFHMSRGGELCLKNVSLRIRGGEKVAVVGRTGAGKSSVAMMLFRMVEKVEGSVVIDESDIMRMDLARHRARITIIPQEYALFQGTLRHNLDPEGKYSDNHLIDAFRQSGTMDFLQQGDHSKQ